MSNLGLWGFPFVVPLLDILHKPFATYGRPGERSEFATTRSRSFRAFVTQRTGSLERGRFGQGLRGHKEVCCLSPPKRGRAKPPKRRRPFKRCSMFALVHLDLFILGGWLKIILVVCFCVKGETKRVPTLWEDPQF